MYLYLLDGVNGRPASMPSMMLLFSINASSTPRELQFALKLLF
ncbi:MAG TPA: hypothetical protein VK604_22180 [Bryobacteraceae bacterium]|nr:hypothetical protein [Bryobacteraceae bacterium]